MKRTAQYNSNTLNSFKSISNYNSSTTEYFKSISKYNSHTTEYMEHIGKSTKAIFKYNPRNLKCNRHIFISRNAITTCQINTATLLWVKSFLYSLLHSAIVNLQSLIKRYFRFSFLLKPPLRHPARALAPFFLLLHHASKNPPSRTQHSAEYFFKRSGTLHFALQTFACG